MTLSKAIYKQRTEDELMDALQRLLDGLWGRKHQDTTLTIPVDELRDADCILVDGINELARLRAIVAQVVESDSEHGDGARCHFCGATPHISGGHAHDCKRDEARRLVADADKGE